MARDKHIDGHPAPDRDSPDTRACRTCCHRACGAGASDQGLASWPDRPTQETRESTSAATGADRTESRPSERSPLINAPVILTPEDRAQQEHDALYANHGGSGAGQPNPMSGPIDTQLANPNLRPNLRAKPNDWKKALLARRLPEFRPTSLASNTGRSDRRCEECHRRVGGPRGRTGSGNECARHLGATRLRCCWPAWRSAPDQPSRPQRHQRHWCSNRDPTNGTGSNATRHDTNPIASAIPSQGLELNGTPDPAGIEHRSTRRPGESPNQRNNGSTLRPKIIQKQRNASTNACWRVDLPKI